MERRAKPPVRCGSVNPSFSSTLLDAIYRSIDETDGRTAREHRNGGAPDRREATFAAAAKKRQSSPAEYWWPAERRSTAVPSERAVTGLRKPDNRRFPVNSTSSSSDCSSYGGFSSSEAESVPRPAGLRPVRTGGFLYRFERARSNPPPPLPPAAASPPAQHHKDKKSGSIRSKFRNLRKANTPASPGARLASFLNSLFTAAGSPRKSKSTTAPYAAGAAPGGGCGRRGAESACSTASSYSRSCLSKTPSSRARPAALAGEGVKRSVRFYPVSVIVDEDSRPCGQKCLYDGDTAAGVTRRLPASAAMAKKRMEELLRGLEGEEEEDDDDEGSDSSSDLFELENLTAIGGRGYNDELPVYETTYFGTNRAISHGFIL